MACDSNRKELVAIIGGMGPMAGVKLQELIVNRTTASCDRDHIPVLCYTNPQVPPRIGDFGLQCVPEIVRSIQALEGAGATRFCIACNTAHMFTSEIMADVKIPMISLIAETAKFLATNFGSAPVIGLLGTNSLMESNLYQDIIKAECAAASVLRLEAEPQAKLDQLIQGKDGIKAGNTGDAMSAAIADIAQTLVVRGATVIVTACTELPLVFNKEACQGFPVAILDPMVIVADHIINLTAPCYKE